MDLQHNKNIFGFPPKITEDVQNLKFQESFSSVAYGGLSHHGLSRLSATTPSLNGSGTNNSSEVNLM